MDTSVINEMRQCMIWIMVQKWNDFFFFNVGKLLTCKMEIFHALHGNFAEIHMTSTGAFWSHWKLIIILEETQNTKEDRDSDQSLFTRKENLQQHNMKTKIDGILKRTKSWTTFTLVILGTARGLILPGCLPLLVIEGCLIHELLQGF